MLFRRPVLSHDAVFQVVADVELRIADSAGHSALALLCQGMASAMPQMRRISAAFAAESRLRKLQ